MYILMLRQWSILLFLSSVYSHKLYGNNITIHLDKNGIQITDAADEKTEQNISRPEETQNGVNISLKREKEESSHRPVDKPSSTSQFGKNKISNDGKKEPSVKQNDTAKGPATSSNSLNNVSSQNKDKSTNSFGLFNNNESNSNVISHYAISENTPKSNNTPTEENEPHKSSSAVKNDLLGHSGNNDCIVVKTLAPITEQDQILLRKNLQRYGSYLQYVYNNIFHGVSICNASKINVSSLLAEISNRPLSMESNKQYTLSYRQENLPDNFYITINSQQKLFNVKWLDWLVNAYIRNGYVLRQSSLFRWYRNRYFPLLSNYTGKGIKIEVIDGDIGAVHQEIEGRVSVRRKEAQYQLSSHPTSVMTAAAGITTGLAKDSTLVLHPVFKFGNGYLSDILHTLDGISMSDSDKILLLPFSGSKSDLLDSSLGLFYNANIPVVVPAGNNGGSSCEYSPSRSKYTITIGSMSDRLGPEPWSNTGQCTDAYASGSATVGDVSELSPTVRYAWREGSSISAAYAAGYIALLMQTAPSSVSEIRELLKHGEAFPLLSIPNIGNSSPFISSNFEYNSIGVDIFILITPLLIIVCIAALCRRKSKKQFTKKSRRHTPSI
ncbi:hypothetical protein NEMIN01_2199 [Nematocida minor]|uniref:uncharacterized protein n=1 Tax=Nematocida minor TaxID=1912983 RepID=UPI00221EAD32|nr:uncharacterized protein NEMIN01_2199 [Nematocida minor]KAI5192754.1 hypothetical protein NEMIN01_2199 [Nematocida minor]